MDFARNQLLKYGWKEGKGLGRNESGITAALKPKLKFDMQGVGHDSSEQFTYHWWEHAFNKAANNIEVSTTEDGVAMKLQDDESIDITTKKYSMRGVKKKNLLKYGTFLKTSTLTQGGQVVRIQDAPELPELNDPLTAAESLTDEDLFRICGGRTAHKGARHGLKLNGKLARIEEQERQLLVQAKQDKKKRWTQNSAGKHVDNDDDHIFCSSQEETKCIQKRILKENKKETKKKSKRPDEDPAEAIDIQICKVFSDDNKTLSDSFTKSKKVLSQSAITDEAQNSSTANQERYECAVFKKKRKSKKSRSESEDHELFCERVEDIESMKQERQSIALLGTGPNERKQKKRKCILSEGVSHTKDTLIIETDIVHEENFGSSKKEKKKKKKNRKPLEV